MNREQIQEVAENNNYSATETAKALGVTIGEFYDLVVSNKIRMYAELKPFVEDTKADLATALTTIQEMLHYVELYANFANGNTDPNGVIDEGNVMASNYLYRVGQKLKELRDRNNL